MAPTAQLNTYLNNHYDGMSPEQLILMLFKGALDRLRKAKQGLEEKNIQKRGENLSKAIAIISELYSSLDPKMNDDGTVFLRGLYSAIMSELPKVSIHNDVSIIDRSIRYIERLTEIWENTVMKQGASAEKPPLKSVKKSFAKPMQRPLAAGGYPPSNSRAPFGSISV